MAERAWRMLLVWTCHFRSNGLRMSYIRLCVYFGPSSGLLVEIWDGPIDNMLRESFLRRQYVGVGCS